MNHHPQSGSSFLDWMTKAALETDSVNLYNCMPVLCISQECRSSCHFPLHPAILVQGGTRKTKPSLDGEFSSIAYRYDISMENA